MSHTIKFKQDSLASSYAKQLQDKGIEYEYHVVNGIHVFKY